jgi:hypothetical protein
MMTSSSDHGSDLSKLSKLLPKVFSCESMTSSRPLCVVPRVIFQDYFLGYKRTFIPPRITITECVCLQVHDNGQPQEPVLHGLPDRSGYEVWRRKFREENSPTLQPLITGPQVSVHESPLTFLLALRQLAEFDRSTQK